MGIYVERLLPRIVNASCGITSAHRLQRRARNRSCGEVDGIGFPSTGTNRTLRRRGRRTTLNNRRTR